MSETRPEGRVPRIAIVATHPIQYYGPWFAHLAKHIDLTVYYAYKDSPRDQAAAGFSTAFAWDVPLLEGYEHVFLKNVARRPGLQHFFGCNTPEAARIIHKGGFDAVILFGWNKATFLQAWRGALSDGTPVFVRLDSQLNSSRSAWKRLAKRPLYSAILPWAASYLSPGVRSDAYLKHYGVGSERIYRLPHMVDVDRFTEGVASARTEGRARALRRAHGADHETIVFLQVGKLIAKKQPLMSLEALAALDPTVLRRVQLWFVGDGPLEEAVAAKAVAEALPVRQLGFVNQGGLPEVYAAADALLLPSSDETWGLVANEAQACGLPVLVSEAAGCAPDLVVPGLTGWTFRSGDVRELARLMTEAVIGAWDLSSRAILEMAQRSSYRAGTDKLLDAIARASDQGHQRGIRLNG